MEMVTANVDLRACEKIGLFVLCGNFSSAACFRYHRHLGQVVVRCGLWPRSQIPSADSAEPVLTFRILPPKRASPAPRADSPPAADYERSHTTARSPSPWPRHAPAADVTPGCAPGRSRHSAVAARSL